MDLNLLNLGILVLAAPGCVFYTTRNQIYWRPDKNSMVFASTLIWYHTQRWTHTGHIRTNRLTHIFEYKYQYTLKPPVACTQQLPALHWMNNLLIQKLICFSKLLLFSQPVTDDCSTHIAFNCLYPNATFFLQLLDVAWFQPLKIWTKEHFNKLPKNLVKKLEGNVMWNVISRMPM